MEIQSGHDSYSYIQTEQREIDQAAEKRALEEQSQAIKEANRIAEEKALEMKEVKTYDSNGETSEQTRSSEAVFFA